MSLRLNRMSDLPRKCMEVDCYNAVDESGDYKAYCEKHKQLEE